MQTEEKHKQVKTKQTARADVLYALAVLCLEVADLAGLDGLLLPSLEAPVVQFLAWTSRLECVVRVLRVMWTCFGRYF